MTRKAVTILGTIGRRAVSLSVRLRRERHLSYSLQLAVRRGWATIGIGSYGYPLLHFYDPHARLRIGAFTSIGAGTTILLGGEHSTNAVTTSPIAWVLGGELSHPATRAPLKSDVAIGSDVWIGCGAIILSGVEIADGAVIGAGSVVRRSVPPYAVVTGNPADIRRYRFDDATIKRLLKVRFSHQSD